jgi:putative FmdB family regulatory protein
MPTYDYKCDVCGHKFEQYHSITASSLIKCPQCGKRALQRLIGTGGGIIFKGSGFYQTDYRTDSYKQGAEAEKKAASPADAGKDAGAKKTEKPAAASNAKKPAKKERTACKAD